MSGFANPNAYERWMGRWSTQVAPAFVVFADLPVSGRFLDVGCGTGVLTAALLERSGDASVDGIDPSTDYIAHCRQRFDNPRLGFDTGNAMAIPFEDDSFDATLSLLILQEIPDAPRAVHEMHRVTRPGGRVATSQFNYENGMPMLELFWQAAVETVDEQATREVAANVMKVAYPTGESLRRLWADAGLVDVETGILEITQEFAGFDDYWAPFLSGVTQSASFAETLDDDRRQTLEDRVRRKVLDDDADRPFALTAQAWAVRGTVPRD